MPLEKISAAKAKALMESGAVLVDVREHSERAHGHIENSVSLPLSQLADKDVPKDADIIIYYCRSGMRTSMKAAALSAKAECKAYILEGGIEAWRRAGQPVRGDADGAGGSRLRGLFLVGLLAAAAVAVRILVMHG